MSEAVLLLYLLGLFVTVAIGYFFTALLWPRGIDSSLPFAIAPAIGAGLSSLIFFLFRRPMFTVEAALAVSLGAAWLYRRLVSNPIKSGQRWSMSFLALFLAAVVGIVFAGLTVRVNRMPHGYWDALAVWNSHARYLFRDGASWQEHIRNTFHPGYGLLVPSMTARLWRYAGEEFPDAGGLVGILLTLTSAAILITTLWELRDYRLAVIVGLILLTTSSYLEVGAAQYADVPLAVYFLSTVALVYFHFEKAPDRSTLLLLAGLTTGCAGWTKNEGILFIFVTTLLILGTWMMRRLSLRALAMFLTGMALPLMVILFFKYVITVESDAIFLYGDVIGRIKNPNRYVMILQSTWSAVWSFGAWVINPMIPLFLLVLLRGIDRRILHHAGWLIGASAILLSLAGYYAIYVISPYDLRWHLNSSLGRLLLQLWPSVLLLVGLAARSLASEALPLKKHATGD